MPNTRYFITLCAENRRPGLHQPQVAEKLIESWRTQHRDGDFELLCSTVMPDHIHVIYRLGDRLSLSQTLVKFKAFTKQALASAGLRWQRNYYDHRMRAEVSIEPFARYVFLNPYRKKLLGVKEDWPWWVLNRNYRPEFYDALLGGKYPQAEWLGDGSRLSDLIEADGKP